MTAAYDPSPASPGLTSFIRFLTLSDYTAAFAMVCAGSIPDLTSYTDELGRNTLQKALLACDLLNPESLKIIQGLLSLSPLLASHMSKNGNTTLHFASFSAPPPVLRLIVLMSSVPLAHLKNTRGRTPLSIACGSNGDVGAVEYLVGLKPEMLFVKDNKGESALRSRCGGDVGWPEDTPPTAF